MKAQNSDGERIDPARVRIQRDRLGISQQDVVERVRLAGFGKLTYQAYQQLEDGSTKKPRYAMYLPDVLETSWEYLTGRTDNPAPPNFNKLVTTSASNGNSTEKGAGEEGTQVLFEISRMLGAVEGSLKTTFNTRFDSIDKKLDDHERRLDAMERLNTGPQKGRRR